MTTPGRPSDGTHDSFETDPTGMRELLRSLPDPEPMPEDLVARITSALHEESARTSPAPTGHEPEHGHPPYGVVTPLAPRRMPLWQRLGAAAAALLVIGGGGAVVLDNLRGGGVMGASSVADSASDLSSSRGPAAKASPESGAPSSARPDGVTGDAGTRVLASGTAYRAADLATQARALLSSTATPLPPLASESPALGPIATPIGLRDCARGLGLPGAATLVLDVASVDGRPAAVLVSTSSGESTAYIVERTCSAADAHRIAGPVRVA
ncbi:MAG: hypothetical protein LWW86_08640 [Micrococcales bacterium]|nr:hypothetical protein [Micrococcales bacterium]